MAMNADTLADSIISETKSALNLGDPDAQTEAFYRALAKAIVKHIQDHAVVSGATVS